MRCGQIHPFIRGGKAGAGRYAGAAGAGTGIPGKTGDNWCGCAVLAGKKTGEKRRHRASGRAAEKNFFAQASVGSCRQWFLKIPAGGVLSC